MNMNSDQSEETVSMRNSARGNSRTESRLWNVLGHSCPSGEIVFISQMFVLLVVIGASLYNLSAGTDKSHETLWTALLSSSLGYILPNPRLKSTPPLT